MKIGKGTLITLIISFVVVIGLVLLLGTWWALGIMLGVVALLALLLLFTSKTPIGRRGGQAVGRRLAKTRVGQRLGRAQLHAEAKRRGVAMVDPLGRELSDLELQLELFDTPEHRELKRQLRGLNPQQRAQALRMIENQAQQVMQTGEKPVQQVPRQPGMSGRPVTRPPRSRKKRKR